MSQASPHSLSQFWSKIAELRADRAATTEALGPDAIPHPTSPHFTSAHLDSLLASVASADYADTTTRNNALDQIWRPIFRLSGRIDLSLRLVSEAPAKTLEGFVASSYVLDHAPEVIERLCDRLLAERISTIYLEVFTLALRASLDRPDLATALCDSDWSRADPSEIYSAFRLYHPTFIPSRAPDSARVIAAWVDRAVSDVWPQVNQAPLPVLLLASLVVPSLSAHTARRLARLDPDLCADVGTGTLANLLVFRDDIPTSTAVDIFWTLAAHNFDLVSTTTKSTLTLMAATKLCDPPVDLESLQSPTRLRPHPVYPAPALLESGRQHASRSQASAHALALFSLARGVKDPASLQYLTGPEIDYLLDSPHTSPQAIFEVFSDLTSVARLGPRLAQRFLSAGVPVSELVPYMSVPTTLSTLDPHPALSSLFARHALASWTSETSRSYVLGDALRKHLNALDADAAHRLVLDAPLSRLVTACQDSSVADVLLPMVDRALSDLSSSELASIYEMSDDWEGSLFELVCVLDAALPSFDS